MLSSRSMSLTPEQEIRKQNRAFEAAVVSRDMTTLAAAYTADARILPPGSEMIAGRDNIRQFWEGVLATLNVSSVTLETLTFEPAGDIGYEVGCATLHTAGGGPVMQVKYVVVWKREDGIWKLHVDIWNTNA